MRFQAKWRTRTPRNSIYRFQLQRYPVPRWRTALERCLVALSGLAIVGMLVAIAACIGPVWR